MTSRRPCWRSKQRNGGHLGGIKYSFGDWTLFLCKSLLLFHYANMASGHMSEHTLFSALHYQRIRDKSKLLIEIYLSVFALFPHEKPASTAFSVLCFDWLLHCLDIYGEAHGFSRDLSQLLRLPCFNVTRNNFCTTRFENGNATFKFDCATHGTEKILTYHLVAPTCCKFFNHIQMHEVLLPTVLGSFKSNTTG